MMQSIVRPIHTECQVHINAGGLHACCAAYGQDQLQPSSSPSSSKAAKRRSTAVYTGSIRHRDPVLCPHGALGRYLIARFTIYGEMFPDPADKQRWHSAVLWSGNRPDQSLSYSGQAAALSRWLAKCGIASSNVTHLFRVAGARAHGRPGTLRACCRGSSLHWCTAF
jgi:Centromere DNA-binding protein complex CBF3 subunit, domain 2